MANDVLAADFESELIVSRASPNFVLGGCERMPHIARPLKNGRINAVAFFWGHGCIVISPHPGPLPKGERVTFRVPSPLCSLRRGWLCTRRLPSPFQ